MKVRREKRLPWMSLDQWVDRLPLNHPARDEYLHCERGMLANHSGLRP